MIARYMIFDSSFSLFVLSFFRSPWRHNDNNPASSAMMLTRVLLQLACAVIVLNTVAQASGFGTTTKNLIKGELSTILSQPRLTTAAPVFTSQPSAWTTSFRNNSTIGEEGSSSYRTYTTRTSASPTSTKGNGSTSAPTPDDTRNGNIQSQ